MSCLKQSADSYPIIALLFMVLVCAYFNTAKCDFIQSVFEPAEIPEENKPEKGEYEFGYLVVPENRQDESNHNTIRLAVAILKCTGDNPQPDPVIYSTGGPGVLSTVRAARHAHDVGYIKTILKRRDFILFEQRGAKYSIPALLGPEIDSLYLNSIGSEIDGKPNRKDLVKVAEKLKRRLNDEGIDLKAYNSTESAADIEDLRRALGIEKWNLAGISYSCRLMLEVMRYYPEGIRAVILDSPLPPDANWDETALRNYWYTLKALFDMCGKDPGVSKKYPDLERRFLSQIADADQTPIMVPIEHPITKDSVIIRLAGQDIFNFATSIIGFGPNIASFPKHINRLCSGNPDSLKKYVDMITSPHDYAWGMRYAFWCNEELPFEDADKICDHTGLPEELSEIELTVIPVEIYAVWGGRKPDAIENQPVSSDIPVLIASGQYDPDTTPEFAGHVAETLSTVHHIIFPGQSHLPLFTHPCALELISQFLDNPETRPDTECLEFFLPFEFEPVD
jgi:pimeloyl-ACP methyl ester carboxylesterase